MYDEERSGCPSVFSSELVCAVQDKIKKNLSFTINALALEVLQISRIVIFNIVAGNLVFRKLCAHWMP